MSFEEHIEEMIRVYENNETPIDPDDIAEDVLDIVCAQGLVADDETDAALEDLRNEARYLLGWDGS